MFDAKTIGDALLKRYLVEFSAGSYLFKQNERGNTMYIILEGRVQISHKMENRERLVAILEEGDVVGEKALCSDTPYRRTFTALAMTRVTALELGITDLRQVQSKLTDFTQKVLALVIKRLDKANILISILQLREDTERLVHYLIYMAKYFGKKNRRGVEFLGNIDSIAEACNVDRQMVADSIKYLIKSELLIKSPEGYVLPDETALISFLPTLRERIAA